MYYSTFAVWLQHFRCKHCIVVTMQPFNLGTVLNIPELPMYISRFEQAMSDVLRTDNQYLQTPIARLLSVRGKRLRPSLVIAAALVDGKITDDVITGCTAIELVHISSLVHDDIIDNAATRWNIPTISSREGSSAAILVGDYLQAKACAHAASISAAVAEVIAEVIATLCEGQALELTDLHNSARTMDAYLATIHGKTAALLAAACKIGGLCAGMSKTNIAALTQYGEAFGMAFQLVDDVLDFLSTPERYGKPTSTDVHEGVYTMPLLLSLRHSSNKNVQNRLRDHEASDLVATMLQDGSIARTLNDAKRYNLQAITALESITTSSALEGLKNLPQAYLQWALSQLVAPEYQNLAGI
jgi:geranylgeranyl pyrophosphate synthase